jgi:hypothetical protein
MTKQKSAPLQKAPSAISERPKRQSRPTAKPKPARSNGAHPPEKFTYALKDYTVEMRKSGWWVSRTWTVSAGEKPQWTGPFATIESVCLSIGRRLAAEIADRHTQSIEWYGLERNDPLYGLKPTTRLETES